ncbi:MAG: EAL domain-containing protein [Rhodospirillales bacterium]|nr:EAL domain-containing protein [Rhodospirillales bacterium]
MAIKKRKTKARKRGFKHWPRAVLIAAVFSAAVCVAFLSFISIPLALLALGVFGLVGMIEAEAYDRSLWEQAASFKFKTLKDGQDALQKQTAQNTRDLAALKRAAPDAGSGDADEDFLSVEAPSKRARLPLNLDTRELPRSPRAVKPSKIAPVSPAQMTDDTFEDLSDSIVRELVHHALHEKRVDVFVQPIQRLPQRQTRFYEMFARIRARPGQYLPASRYMEVAEQDNLDHEIDALLLLHCLKTIQGSAHVKRAAPFFINIKNATLKNGVFMKRLLGFVAKNRELAPRLVFEIRQSDFDAMEPALLEIMRGLGALGCSFSLEQVDNLQIDVADLMHFKVRYVKIDTAQLLQAGGNSKDFATLNKAKRKLEANGIGVIATKIETEEQMRSLLDFDLHYGQGYLFGKPELEGAYKNRARIRRKGVVEDVA